MYVFCHLTPKSLFVLRITEDLRLEETSEGHLQPFPDNFSLSPRMKPPQPPWQPVLLFIPLQTETLNLFPSARLQSEIWNCCLKSMGKEVLDILAVGNHV